MRLEFVDIEKSFGEKQVLKGISFAAEGGKAFGLLGRNGAGKTTSIRIMMNVFRQSAGEVLFDGRPIDHKKIKFGYLPEERGLYPKKKIIDQLVYFAELHGLSHADAVKSVDYWLKRLGMDQDRNKRLDVLSKGNQQKIQLITALAHDPQVIVLDEPFSGLDPVNAMILKDVVRQEIDKGKILLFSSHQMSHIEEFCDSIAILNDGKIAVTGDLRDIKRSYPRNKLVVSSPQCERICSDLGHICEKRADRTLLIELSSPESKSDMMKTLTSSYDIDRIEVFEPSLNDIFVQYASEDR